MNLCDLINAIFIDTVASEIGKLRTEKCCRCKIDHPSQRRHDYIMITEEEGWIEHGMDAIERVLNQQTIWKRFIEAIRVIK